MTENAELDEPGLIERREVHDGDVVHLTVDTVRFPDGSTGELEMIRHSGAAAVLPFLDPPADPDPRIMLVEQYRYASGGYLLEVPAGRPDEPGEPWEECARRELEEETGLVAERLVPLSAIYTTPGFTDEKIHLFMGVGVSSGTVARDSNEFIETVTLPISRALQDVHSGRISDAKTVCTLLLAEHLRHGVGDD